MEVRQSTTIAATTIESEVLNVKDKLIGGYLTQHADRKSIHISDTITCLRQNVFRRLDPNSTISDKQLKYFIQGELTHAKLEEWLGKDFDCEKGIVWTSPRGIRIISHPDAIYKRDGAIVEIKTTENTQVTQQPLAQHVKQLKLYLSIFGSAAKYGKLLYVILGTTSRLENYFPEYLVTVDENERTMILDQLERDAIAIMNGVFHKDPSLVSHIANNSNYMRFGRNYICANCPYREPCDAIRAEQEGNWFGSTTTG